ncbi:MAG TPA: sialidase family protein [Nitriliruptorales bacterium]
MYRLLITSVAIATASLLAVGALPAAAQTPDGPAYACRQDLEPQNDDHPGVHVAALEEAPSGDLLYIFYAGSGEANDDVRTYMSRMVVGSEDWTAPDVVYDEPGEPDGNAVLWVDDANDRVHLLFSTIMGDGWTEANLRMIHSDDDGVTWTEPEWVREEWGWLFGNLPFRMSNGEVIVPIYSETEWKVGWYISDDDLASMQAFPGEDDTTWPGTEGGSIQPATIELEDGHLLALLRTRNSGGLMYQTESFDYGRTWSEVESNGLAQNNSRVALIKLDDGTLVLAYNPVSSGRTPLSLSYSTDDGQTWSAPQNIEDAQTAPLLPFGNPEFSYPYLLQTTDGMIHLGYTHRRDTMRHIAFNQAFLLSGDHMPSNASQTEKTEYVDGEISQVEACQFDHLATASAGGGNEPAPSPEPVPDEESSTLPATGAGAAVLSLFTIGLAAAGQRARLRTGGGRRRSTS